MLTMTDTLASGTEARDLDGLAVTLPEPIYFETNEEARRPARRLALIGPSVATDDTEALSIREGTIQPAHHGVAIRPGWIPSVTDSRVHWGAELNPLPVNGAYYRTIAIGEGGFTLLVRYNDDDHVGDRAIATCPWTLLKQGEDVWHIPNDGIAALSSPYVRVRYAEEGATLDDMPNPGNLGLDELNPTPVDGKEYIAWEKNVDQTIIHFLVAHDGKMVHVGSSPWSYPEGVTHGRPREFDVTQYHYRELKYVDRVALEEETLRVRRDNMRTYLNTETARWDEFRDALVEKAEEASWCGEFDAIISRLGMQTRTQEYNIDLQVSATLTNTYTRGDFDEQVASELGLEDYGVTVNEARFEISVSVSTTRSGANGGDAAASLDSSEVEDIIDNLIPHGWSVSVDDWEVTDTSTVD